LIRFVSILFLPQNRFVCVCDASSWILAKSVAQE
jgi:hypothetical protein